MKTKPWNRGEIVESLKDDVWRYLTQAAVSEKDLPLAAARLLQMRSADVQRLAQLHFVLSKEVGDLLTAMPALSRRLSTTSAYEREASAERVRGPINWAETFSERAASGLPHLFVTSPARRAFNTPENQMLKFSLDAVAHCGRRTGWQSSTTKGVGSVIRSRVNEASRWGQLRALSDVPLKPVSSTEVARVRSGRLARPYEAVIAAFAKYEELIARLNRSAIRSAIENHALISRDDPVLLELLCTFRAIEILRNQGWQGYEIDLMEGGKVFSGVRGSERLALYYQRTPKDLREGSIYREVQKAHAFPGVGELRPDLVIELHDRENNARWILLEVKGVDRPVEDSARAALQDLLGYRRAFEPILSNQNGVYGIGAAWGEVVEPAHEGEILLCSPDTLASAIATATGAMSASAANS